VGREDEDRLAAEQRARVLIDRHYSLPDSCYGGPTPSAMLAATTCRRARSPSTFGRCRFHRASSTFEAVAAALEAASTAV